MGRPKEHDEETREALRVAAERLFDEGGSKAVSVRAVADEVGTTTRAVYSLFGSLDGLVVDALAARAYQILKDGLDAQIETDDPAHDLVEAAVTIFRPFVRRRSGLFRITFQRVVPNFDPGPELVEARRSALLRLSQKVARLESTGQLGETTVDDALIQFQALCEGLGNFELRGDALRLLPEGGEEEAWRRAFINLVRGFLG